MARIIRKNKSQSMLDYAVLLAAAISSIVVIGYYVRNSVVGRWRESADSFGQGEIYRPSGVTCTKKEIQNCVVSLDGSLPCCESFWGICYKRIVITTSTTCLPVPNSAVSDTISNVNAAGTVTKVASVTVGSDSTAGSNTGNNKGNSINMQSSSFIDGGFIPDRFSYTGGNTSPGFVINNIPEGTKSLAIIAYDDNSVPLGFTHWVSYDIAPTANIYEGSDPGIKGINDYGEAGYGGPDPPGGTHNYHFVIYALDARLNLEAGKTKVELTTAMTGHILGQTELTGKYQAK